MTYHIIFIAFGVFLKVKFKFAFILFMLFYFLNKLYFNTFLLYIS